MAKKTKATKKKSAPGTPPPPSPTSPPPVIQDTAKSNTTPPLVDNDPQVLVHDDFPLEPHSWGGSPFGQIPPIEVAKIAAFWRGRRSSSEESIAQAYRLFEVIVEIRNACAQKEETRCLSQIAIEQVAAVAISLCAPPAVSSSLPPRRIRKAIEPVEVVEKAFELLLGAIQAQQLSETGVSPKDVFCYQTDSKKRAENAALTPTPNEKGNIPFKDAARALLPSISKTRELRSMLIPVAEHFSTAAPEKLLQSWEEEGIPFYHYQLLRLKIPDISQLRAKKTSRNNQRGPQVRELKKQLSIG
jgi:hypothetical protein